MPVLSNLTFVDDPRPVGRFVRSLNTSALDRVIPAAKEAAARGGVLLIDDEATLDSSPDRIRAAVAAANKACPVLVYARPKQRQYAISDYARASASKLAANRWAELPAQPENAAMDAWRRDNDADRAAGLYDGVAACCVEFRQYEAFDPHEQAIVTAAEARRASALPVAALVDPRYPDGIRPALAGRWVPRDRMRALLWALRGAVDDLLVWHGQPEPRTREWNDFLADAADAFGPFEGAR